MICDRCKKILSKTTVEGKSHFVCFKVVGDNKNFCSECTISLVWIGPQMHIHRIYYMLVEIRERI